MKVFWEHFWEYMIIVAWIAGIVLAKGEGMKIVAFFFPPYAWYKVVQLCMQRMGLI